MPHRLLCPSCQWHFEADTAVASCPKCQGPAVGEGITTAPPPPMLPPVDDEAPAGEKAPSRRSWEAERRPANSSNQGLVLGLVIGGVLFFLFVGGMIFLGFYLMLSTPDPAPPQVFRGGPMVAQKGMAKDDGAKHIIVEPEPRQNPFIAPPDIVAMPQNVKAGPVVANALGMKLAQIPPGEFVMGSPATEQGRKPDEGPQHRVRITQPFWMGVHEVSYGDFRAFVKETGHNTQGGGRPWETPGRWVPKDEDPVVNVSWNDADSFCKWLSKKEGKTYRLPTEAEWEYACRAGTTTPFHFGDALSSQQANFNGQSPYNAAAGPFRNRGIKVGSFAPNAFGLFDMHGNAWEWCLDWYDANYYRNSPVDDPKGPAAGNTHALRSGGFYRTGADCRAANREPYEPNARFDNTGFRVVREQAAADPAPVDLLPNKDEAPTGKELDLLKLVDPKTDAVRGNWQLDGQALVVTGLEPFARLALPVRPAGDYHVLVKFTRLRGNNGPILNLPVGSSVVQFALDSGARQFTALELLDDHSVDSPENPTNIQGIRIVDNKSYTLEAQVLTKGDQATIRIDLDGKRILDWTGKTARLSISKDWSLGDDSRLGLHPWGLDMRFETVHLRMLSGEAKLVRKPK